MSGATEKITDSINVDIETLENPTGYQIMDILTDLFSVVCYTDCGANLKLLETKKQGISFHLLFVKVRNVNGHILLGHIKRRQKPNTLMLIGEIFIQ